MRRKCPTCGRVITVEPPDTFRPFCSERCRTADLQDVIARLFMERGAGLLKPGGRFYLVTRQPNAVEEQIVHLFGEVEVVPQRAYAVFVASQPLPAAARGARRDDR